MSNQHRNLILMLVGVVSLAACTRINPTQVLDGKVVPGKDNGSSPADQGSSPADNHAPPPADTYSPPPQEQGTPPPPDQSVPPPPESGVPTCPPGKVQCNGICVDLKKDDNHCGKCGASCGGGHCLSGLCCPKTNDRCGNACVDLQSDAKNCGTCGNACKAQETCSGGVCKGATGSPCDDGSVEQTFNKGMVGCAGKVEWSKRANLCGKGYRVCKAKEWVDRRGNKTPGYNYWTNEELRYYGYGTSYCYVHESKGGKCPSGQPMRVCVNSNWGYDKLGNRCSWYRCGYHNYKPNLYFGGCKGNKTASSLCCPK